VTTLTRRSDAGALGYRRVPWPLGAWVQAMYVCAAIPAQLPGLAVPVIFGYWTRNWALSKWPLPASQPLHPLWLLEAAAVFLAVPALTALHRRRVWVTAGAQIPPQPTIPRRLSVRGVCAAARSPATWRQLGYHLVAGPVLAAGGIAVLGVWLAGALYTLVYGYAWALPHRSLLWRGRSPGGPANHRPELLRTPVDAYFVVSEALTNVAKHAQASQAEVFVQRAGDRLHVIISDDGVGGADPARGTGLAGLAKRASSVDGIFEIASPPGGPTLITVDLPCAR
jgi:hypothetical protein